MKRRLSFTFGWILMALIVVATNVSFAADGAEKAAVEQAAAGFYDALNAMFTGDVQPMQQVWSHAQDVTYMGPDGGIRVGWDKVLSIWKLQADKKLGGHVAPTDMHITVEKDMAIVQNYEKGENKLQDGKTETVSIRATNVFRKEDGQWKMVSHHTDLLPYLVD